MTETKLKSVILTPYGTDDPSRKLIWDWTKKWWSTNTNFPIYEGSSWDGSHFNISEARNKAAQAAGDWDVAIIIDADTILLPIENIAEAIRTAYETNILTLPYDTRWEISRSGTEKLLADTSSDWQGDAGRCRWGPISGCVIISRTLWDKVGGFDPAFKGWGHEDGAFMLACGAISGTNKLNRMPGGVWHLDHTPSSTKSPSHPRYQKNFKRWLEYSHAMKSEDPVSAIRSLRTDLAPTGSQAQ